MPLETAIDLAARLRRREVGAIEIATETLERMDRLQPALNAIVWIDRDDVIARAMRSQERIDAGSARPFEGVPLPIKGLTDVAGQPNDYCSTGMSVEPACENDIVVDLFERAGFVLFGRTNSPEFGALPVTENLKYGPTRNPWNLDVTPGGSSGGAAAAVASGMVTAAHASDGGGSIRVPASATGLVGIKPSRGRVPNDVRYWEHSTTEGVLTRTVMDAAAILDEISVHDRLAWYSAPPLSRPLAQEALMAADRLRVGVLMTSPSGVAVDPECVAAARRTADALADLGHDVFEASPFLFSAEAALGFVDTIISAHTAAMPFEDLDEISPYLKYRLRLAGERDSGAYARIATRLQHETRAVAAQWGRDFDVLLTPTMACLAPPIGVVGAEADSDPSGPLLWPQRMTAFTLPVNIAGLPAVSVPAGIDARGVPVGAQLVGAPFDEGTLVRIAAQLEEASSWLERTPAATAAL